MEPTDEECVEGSDAHYIASFKHEMAKPDLGDGDLMLLSWASASAILRALP